MSSMEHFSADSETQEEKKDSPQDSLRRSMVEESIATDETVLERAEKEKQYKEESLERNQERFEKYKENVERARNELDAHKSNFIKRILERKRLAELQLELGFREALLQDEERDRERAQELIQGYEKIIAEENEVNSLLDEAYKENAEFDERKQAEFREEEAGHDLKNLAQEHNVFFVHDIADADWKPSENNNALDTRKLGFKDQLNVVMGLEPTISVSTLSPGSKNRTFGYGSWGVFLSSGRVVGGAPTDVGTIANGLHDRGIDERYKSNEAIAGAIEGHKSSDSYNELVLERPKVAGIYCKWGEGMPELKQEENIFLANTKERRYDLWWKKLEEAMASGAPLFVIAEDKTVRNIYDVNLKERSFRVSGVWKPEDMVDTPEHMQQHHSSDARASAIREVVAKAPDVVPEEEKKLAEENPNYQGNSLNIH